MKANIKGLSLVLLVFAFPVFAETSGQEIHIYPNGEIHLIGAEIFRKHANNFFTLKSWDIKWTMPIDLTDTKIKIESAYGVPIELSEILEGHLLEIKGKTKYQNFEHSIDPILIKDLSIKKGELLPPPPIPPVPISAPVPTPMPAPTTSSINSGKLTMTLKPGYWGGQVKILQEFLKKQGYFPKSESTSRYFGPATKSALMEFQKANALEAAGTLGPKTRVLINSLLGQ